MRCQSNFGLLYCIEVQKLLIEPHAEQLGFKWAIPSTSVVFFFATRKLFHSSKKPKSSVLPNRCCSNAGNALGHCPPGSTELDDQCFYFSATQSSWSDAESECRRRGGSLAPFSKSFQTLVCIDNNSSL